MLYQADYVDQFVSCWRNLKCEIPGDDDPRCANGGPYTRIFFSGAITKATGCISSTLSGPRSELQRTLDGEYGKNTATLPRSKPTGQPIVARPLRDRGMPTNPKRQSASEGAQPEPIATLKRHQPNELFDS